MSFLFPSQTITLEAALRDLVQGSPRARTAAAHALSDVRDPAEKRRAVAALVDALDDDRPEVRAQAASSLGELGASGEPAEARDPAVLAKLIRRLDDGVPGVRQHAAIALGTLGDPAGFAALAAALGEGPADLRFQAATSLAEIDPARAYEPLIAALGDPDPQVVAAAALSLGAIGDARAVPVLANALSHASAATRFDVAYALAELGDPSGRDLLVAGVADSERAWDAVTALGLLGRVAPADATDALGRALVGKHTPPEATVLAAGTILKLAPDSVHHDAARRVLLAGLAARKLNVRGLAVEQLGEIGGSWAIAPLEKLAASSKGAEVGDATAAALAQIRERTSHDPGGRGKEAP